MPLDAILADPLVRNLVLAAAGFIVLIFVIRVFTTRRARREIVARQAELRRDYATLRLQQDEIRELAARIEATSSTGRIPGFSILRQVETVFSEAKPSSVSAVEQVKAFAAQKKANAIIHLQSQQMPSGKWVASGDAVVVKLYGRPLADRTPPGQVGPKPVDPAPQPREDEETK